MQSALETITDVAHHFIIRLTKLLKLAVDLEDGANAHGFPVSMHLLLFFIVL
jgi:hypothetical protein